MEPLAIRLHENDNVITAKGNIGLNSLIGGSISTNQRIPIGHKIATKNIVSGEEIIKYNNIIGVAKENIRIGDHVHVHNTGMAEWKKDYQFSQGCNSIDFLPESERATFMGYKRDGGKVGTRNFIGIISSVNCSATVCKKILSLIHI